MKVFKIFSFIVLLLSINLGVNAQNAGEEKLNLPGDNLNLYAVIKLFQESETIEGFEKNLNAEESKINNLDLNGDDLIDYIKVIDYVDGESHTIVMQVAVTETENQDVAVFTVFKDDKNQLQIQLVGDETLYGKDYIIEPNYDDVTASETPNPGYTGNTTVVDGETVVVTKTTYVEVQTWPVVRYIYTPSYVVWRSPWRWGYYPSYWNPWRPYYWDYYYGYHSHWHHHYYGHYRHSYHYRYPNYSHNYYNGHRNSSATVRNNRDNNRYKDTYSRPDLRKDGSEEFNRRNPNQARPAVLPSTGGGSTARPAVKPDNAGKPATRPAEKPTARPTEGRPAVKPDNTGKPATRPAEKPTARPTEGKPAVKPGTTGPQTKPAVKPTAKPAARPATKPGTTGPQAKPAVKPTTKPAARPATKPGTSGKTVKPSTQPKKTSSGVKKVNGSR